MNSSITSSVLEFSLKPYWDLINNLRDLKYLLNLLHISFKKIFDKTLRFEIGRYLLIISLNPASKSV